MRLLEHQAKRIFSDFGVPVPKGVAITSPEEILSAVDKVGLPVAIKAQVPVGGRGKAHGIRFADSPEEALDETRDLFEQEIRGHKVSCVLVEERIAAGDEYYVGMTIDHLSGTPVLMFSTKGGVDINTVAKECPEALVSRRTSLVRGLFQFEALEICRSLELKGSLLLRVCGVLHTLYRVFAQYDAVLAEINPLLITNRDEICAADAALDIDDDSLFRHPELRLNERHQDETRAEAARFGLSYVRLDGDIGVIGSGAGLSMATVDLIRDFGGRPANFLETGGGITEELMSAAVELVLKDKRLRALLINLYGGINPMPLAAKGIVKALGIMKPGIPVLVKLVGNQQEEAWSTLEHAGIPVAKDIQTEKAVAQLMTLCEE